MSTPTAVQFAYPQLLSLPTSCFEVSLDSSAALPESALPITDPFESGPTNSIDMSNVVDSEEKTQYTEPIILGLLSLGAWSRCRCDT